MKASIVIIGDEILLGQVTDTNSGFIARNLGKIGFAVASTRVVGDDASSIRDAVEEGMRVSDLVITTGGLGPTKDDITKNVLAEFFGGGMVYNEDVAANVERVFAARNLKVNDLTRMQAWVPSSCRVIQNKYGTAPLMWFERGSKVLVSMPGVPFESVGMVNDVVLDMIKRHFTPDVSYLHHTLMVTGIPESALAERLSGWEEALPSGMHLAYLPVPGFIKLRLDGVDVPGHVYQAELAKLRVLVAEYFVYDGDATPAEIVLRLLREKGLTLATAESCTGGNIAHSITEIPGSSESYLGSVVSYSNSVKQNLLGVSASDLERYGAVSEPVVHTMAEGAARVIGADCAVATSGIAGPGGGSPEKPVGTVWMAVHTPKGTKTSCSRFPGDRSRVIDRATTEVLLMLIKELRD